MNPSAIYSKSGKGVQEASGKTSLLKRGDRAVLSAIDGRATLAEVAQKCGKTFDAAFQQLISQLDKDGFVREVTAGAASASSSQSRPGVATKPAAPAAKAPPPSKSPATSTGGDDLDFTTIMPAIKPGTTAPPKAATPPPPKPAAPPPPPPKPDAAAQERAKAQENALYKAREEAEARAQAERDRVRQEVEAKARSEAEEKIRIETEKRIREEAAAKVKAEAEAKAKAAREAALKFAAEAKAKAEAEAQRKLEAERKLREEAERKAREEAERARREAEELRQKLEEERKAREAEERKRREEEERRRKEEEERRAREEAERKAREEAERKRREEEERRRREEEQRRLEEEERRRREEEDRRRREEIEAKAREAAERARREEEDRLIREKEELARRGREEDEARARQEREEEEARARRAKEEEIFSLKDVEEEEARARRALEETRARQPVLPAAPPPPPPEPAKPSGGSLDALMADLDSFSQREEEERATREAAERKLREEKKRAAQEDAERKAREQAAQQERERQRQAEEARRKEEEERRAQEEAERRVREAEELRQREAEERKRRAKETLAASKEPQSGAAAAAAGTDDIGVTAADLGMDDVKRDEAAIAKETRKQQREREREARQREKEARDRARGDGEAPVTHAKARRPIKWGKPVAITLFILLVGAIGALHVVSLPMADYEQAATEALGTPVRIRDGRLSLFTGVRLNLEGVTVGNSVKIASVHAYPRIGSLIEDRKTFRRLDIEGITIPQAAIAEALGASLRGNAFDVGRIQVKGLKLDGPVPLPTFEGEVDLAKDGTLANVTLRGPEGLNAKLTPLRGSEFEFDVTAGTLTLPFAPEVSLGSFAMKGVANRAGMNITSWGGSTLDGALSGTASVRWTSGWQVEGALQARNINAAVFAPALLSEGKAEGTGRFSMSGADPLKLGNAARIEGSFNVGKGVLGSFDLSRVLQTSGRQHAGRTPFTEMSGQGVYERGAVALRGITITAGALNASAAADIAPGGALAGRIVADIRTTVQPLRAVLILGGTLSEPQVRN